MGCYVCGSEEGSVSRLCPACNEERLESRGRGRSEVVEKTPRVCSISTATLLQGSAFALLLVLAFYFVLFSSHGPGLALSPADRVMAKCKRNMNTAEMKSKMRSNIKVTDVQGPAKDLAKAMEGAMVELVGGLGDAMCEAMAEECRNNPNGRPCQSMLKNM